MAFIHGKDTKVIIDSTDLSEYLNSAEPSRTADVGETTTFGSSGTKLILQEKRTLLFLLVDFLTQRQTILFKV